MPSRKAASNGDQGDPNCTSGGRPDTLGDPEDLNRGSRNLVDPAPGRAPRRRPDPAARRAMNTPAAAFPPPPPSAAQQAQAAAQNMRSSQGEARGGRR